MVVQGIETPPAAAPDIFDRLPDAVVVIDGTGTVIRGNRAVVRIMGRPATEWIGSNALDLVHPDDLQLAALSLASVGAKEVGTPIELRVVTDDGWRLVELVGAPLDDGHLVLSIRDLTDRRRWEVAGGEVARFRSLVHHASSVTMLLDADGVVASVSGAITRGLGLDPELVCDQPLVQIVHPDDRMLVRGAIVTATSTPSGAPPILVEARLTARTGPCVPFELSIVSLLDDPTVQGLVVSGHDISRLCAAREALDELAHVDSLTGLPNRRAFDAALEREWALATRQHVDSYVVVADLDHFKRLNDHHGHAAGDDALRQVAAAMRASVRASDLVARIGGDEFAIILTHCGGGQAERFAASLRDRMAETGRTFPSEVTLSVGHAPLRTAASASKALHFADLAMLALKARR